MIDNSHQYPIFSSSDSYLWQQPEVIRWSQILAQNYQQLLGKELFPSNTPEELAKALFHAPFVIVSHGTQTDPIFNYGNQTALQLWSLSWEELIKTPSRLIPILKKNALNREGI